MSVSQHRARQSEHDEESSFISMTDMTVSILFIVLILLAFFASQLRPEQSITVEEYERVKTQLEERDLQLQEMLELMEGLTNGTIDIAKIGDLQTEIERLSREVEQYQLISVANTDLELEVSRLRDELDRLYRLISISEANPLQVYNGAVAAERHKLLLQLRDQIDTEFPELGVKLSAGLDALQFQGEGLFSSGSATLSPDGQSKIRRIAEIIDAALPCFTLGERSEYSTECNPSFAVIEALQIEGHTDSVGTVQSNLSLSSRRAAATYAVMIGHLSLLSEHLNLLGQPVLSVAGYGEDRPVAENESNEGKSANRRIDLRFIMLRPSRVEEIKEIEAMLILGANK